ncbi:MAG: hypothetical protein HYS05_20990 [Acidobacteria bacterium]|nr:hypothetical protein [Acidobacteriota bacterium]
MGVRLVVALVPLVWLYVDWWMFPAAFESRTSATEVRISDLLAHQRVELGTYRAHRFYVAIENIAGSSFLADLNEPSALLISHFVSEDEPGKVTMGQLARVVEARLVSVDPALGHRFTDWIVAASRRNAGEALDLSLDLTETDRRHIPLDRIILVTLENGPSGIANESIGKALAGAFVIVARHSTANFIVPCVGYNWEDNNTIDFPTYFNLLFDSVPAGPRPRAIHLSLYSNWPTFALERAVGAINAAWQRRNPVMRNWTDITVYRGDIRWTLLLLSVCLFTSLGFVCATPRSVGLILTTYVGAVIAGDSMIRFLFADTPAGVVAALQVITRGGLAVGFPLIIRWKAEDLFGSRS